MNNIENLKDLIIYQSQNNENISVEVLYDEEDFWLTQKSMSELFGVEVNTINYHLKEIFKSQELQEKSVIRKIRITANDGKKYNTNFYSLDAIIAVGYRVNSKEATDFRIWATNTLKEYIKKGFVMNSEFLKNGPKFGKDYFDELLVKIKEIRASERRFYQKITDIYKECSFDYDKNSETTQEFYKNVQNKLHFAITGMTAPEIIYNRVDSKKENMGLTTWKNAPNGRILETDVTIANNIDYSNEKLKIEDLPEDYNYIQAIQDKCIISSQGFKVFNKDELDIFLNKVNNNEPYSIRTINYTVEGDMMITDVNFEGNNIFSTCCDWTRDKFSSKEDRTYRYGKFSKLVTEQANGMIYILLKNKIEGDLEEVTITYYKDNAKSINNYEFKYLLNVTKSNKTELYKVTQGELAKKYNYDIYYYGLENVKVKINNTEIDLKEALLNNKVTMEQIIEQAEVDKENEVINADMYKEGGTMIYWYGTYTIIKSHSLDGNRDVYIGLPEMTLNSVR